MMKVCETCCKEFFTKRKTRHCSRSCGNTRHGQHNSFEYRVWSSMKARCNNPTATSYEHYGGRGIEVCSRWESFESFLSDMKEAPSKDYSIERYDVNGNYSPDNCFWLLREKQTRNTRRSHMIEFNGKTQCLSAWCEELGIDYYRTHSRITKLGWSIERALTV